MAAIKAAQLGLRTVVVERRAALGGTCLNVGCIPSKALLQSSHLYHQAQHTFAKHGIDLSGLSLNLPAMHGQKERAVRSLTDGIAMLFKKNGIQWVSGTASLDGPNRVLVDGGVTASVEAKNIIIATGSDPAPLGGFAIDEERIVTSTGALALQTVPKRLVVVGGGIIGLELVKRNVQNIIPFLGIRLESPWIPGNRGRICRCYWSWDGWRCCKGLSSHPHQTGHPLPSGDKGSWGEAAQIGCLAG